MLKDITYEEFKGNSAKIKRRIKKELLASGAFNPKRKKCYRRSEVRMNVLGGLSKDELTEQFLEMRQFLVTQGQNNVG